MDKTELLAKCRSCQARIESSFPKIKFKGIRDLFDLERCWGEEECIEAANMLVGRHWRELAADKIAGLAYVVPLFALKAKIAFLPAFLWWSLDYQQGHENEHQEEIASHAIHFICPTNLKGELNRGYLAEYSDCLSKVQKAVVLEWIDVLLLMEFHSVVRILGPVNEVRKLLGGNDGKS